jgi:hypothetical protein
MNVLMYGPCLQTLVCVRITSRTVTLASRSVLSACSIRESNIGRQSIGNTLTLWLELEVHRNRPHGVSCRVYRATFGRCLRTTDRRCCSGIALAAPGKCKGYVVSRKKQDLQHIVNVSCEVIRIHERTFVNSGKKIKAAKRITFK